MTKKLSKKNETTIIRFSALTVAEVMMKNPILLKLRSLIFSIFADSGIKTNDVKLLKELEDENTNLKNVC